MANQTKAPGKKGGWSSMLSSAVAGLESRLDTILADDPDPNASQQAGKDAKPSLPAANSSSTQASALKPAAGSETGSSSNGTREVSRSRTNDRLAERLARITAQKSRVGSDAGGSRTASPARSNSARVSTEVKREAESEAPVEVVEEKVAEAKSEEDGEDEDAAAVVAAPSMLLASSLPINPARHSLESSRPSMEMAGSEEASSSRPSIELVVNGNARTIAEFEAEMERMRAENEEAEKQRQEEMHAHLERIDALQAKLQYLAKETVAAAKEANASTASGSLEARVVEKDEQIALLMQEGQQLSKTELRHLQTIKKLRLKGTDDEKALLDMRKKLDKAERSEMEQKHRTRRAEVAERQAQEKTKQMANLDRQLDVMRAERDKAMDQVVNLQHQLKDAEKRAESAVLELQIKVAEADKNKIADLENELEDAQIEKKLSEDRAQAEIKRVREDGDRQRERWAVTELELVNEIKAIEARLEATRVRAEEASSEAEGAEGSAKLLRQIELLQNQYNLAKSNWETIEGSLNTRMVAMEKDRAEASKREAEVRKKARDAGTKARKAEEDLEGGNQQIKDLQMAAQRREEQIESHRRNAQEAETALADAKADAERQKRIWESELSNRIEEERARWQRSVPQHKLIRTDSSPVASRKASYAEIVPRRGPPKFASAEPFHGFDRSFTRRSSAAPTPPLRTATATPDRDMMSPGFGQHEGILGLNDPNGMPPTPSIEIEREDDSDHASSPQQTINDIVSTTVTGAGPSVQLVERMSAAVRRLETDKAAHKDELARLTAQRDEARDQIVSLMREVEGVRAGKRRIVELEKEMKGVQQRYEACLEMLGEREEEIEELRADVDELKKMYRELVEQKVGN